MQLKSCGKRKEQVFNTEVKNKIWESHKAWKECWMKSKEIKKIFILYSNRVWK